MERFSRPPHERHTIHIPLTKPRPSKSCDRLFSLQTLVTTQHNTQPPPEEHDRRREPRCAEQSVATTPFCPFILVDTRRFAVCGGPGWHWGGGRSKKSGRRRRECKQMWYLMSARTFQSLLSSSVFLSARRGWYDAFLGCVLWVVQLTCCRLHLTILRHLSSVAPFPVPPLSPCRVSLLSISSFASHLILIFTARATWAKARQARPSALGCRLQTRKAQPSSDFHITNSTRRGDAMAAYPAWSASLDLEMAFLAVLAALSSHSLLLPSAYPLARSQRYRSLSPVEEDQHCSICGSVGADQHPTCLLLTPAAMMAR